MDANKKTNKETVLLQTLTTIFKPLVRLLIHQNITYIGLHNLLKNIYVKDYAASKVKQLCYEKT